MYVASSVSARPDGIERTWPLDLVPRIITGSEWGHIENEIIPRWVVEIGRGRDYEDVMLLRRVYHGDAKATLAGEVTMAQTVVSERIPVLSLDQ